MYLIQDKVHVLPADLRADDHHPEKIGLVMMDLVAHHHTALLHHALFHHRGHLNRTREGTLQWLSHTVFRNGLVQLLLKDDPLYHLSPPAQKELKIVQI